MRLSGFAMLRQVGEFAFFGSLMELWQGRTGRTFILQQEYALRYKEVAEAETENRLGAYIDERRAVVRDRANVSLSIQLDLSLLEMNSARQSFAFVAKPAPKGQRPEVQGNLVQT